MCWGMDMGLVWPVLVGLVGPVPTDVCMGYIPHTRLCACTWGVTRRGEGLAMPGLVGHRHTFVKHLPAAQVRVHVNWLDPLT